MDFPTEAEAVIVGAGVMGCSLAFHLARMGLREVVLLDRGQIGQGATLACAGGIRAQFSTEINIRIGMEAKRMLRNFEPVTGRSADYRPIGYLFLLQTPEERAAFHQHVLLQRRLGLDDVRELSPRAAADLVPGLVAGDLSGATFCPSDGLAGPAEVTYGYAAAARRLGVEIREQAAVTGFLLRGDRVEGVEVDGAELKSAETVICAGPWAGQMGALAGVDIPVVPSKRHVFVSGALPAIDRGMPMTIDFHTSFYFHPEGEGVLFGMGDRGQAPGFDIAVDWTFADRIAAVARHRWPPLLEAPVKTAWAGLYEMTPDFQPLVGPLPSRPGAWIAAGFSGHGFMMAPVIGKWLAEWIIQGQSPVDLTPFGPARFGLGQTEPERNVV